MSQLLLLIWALVSFHYFLFTSLRLMEELPSAQFLTWLWRERGVILNVMWSYSFSKPCDSDDW